MEYKGEGMKTFEEMWNSIRQRVTDTVFHVEGPAHGELRRLDLEGDLRPPRKSPPASGSQIAEQQQAAIDGTQSEKKPEPIRNRQPR